MTTTAHLDSFFDAPSGRSVQVKVHRAVWSGDHPENSLAALEECLRAGVARTEIDVAPLADLDFALVHGRSLDESTDGAGRPADLTRQDASRLRLRWRGELTRQPLALLSDAVELIAAIDGPTLIELDVTSLRPMPEPRVAELVAMVQPVKHRIVLNCSDWNLRRMLRVDPTLPVGCGLWPYLDWQPEDSAFNPETIGIPLGAYGYYDSHLMARRGWTSVEEYLSDRVSGILRLVPGVTEAHLSLPLFERMLDDAPGAAELFHREGVAVDVYTLNADALDWQEQLARVVASGVDVITSDTPRAIAEAGHALSR